MRAMIGLAVALGLVFAVTSPFAYSGNEQAPPTTQRLPAADGAKPPQPSTRRPSASAMAEKIALSYLNAWSKQDFSTMWEIIEHEHEKNWWPATDGKERFRQRMETFPAPVRSPKILRAQESSGGTVAVRYTVQAPLLGCLTLLFLQGPGLEEWPAIIRRVPSFHNTEGEAQVNSRGKVVFDSSDLFLLAHQASNVGRPMSPDLPGPWL